MPEPLLIAHDIGTSATKTSLVGADGSILESESTGHPTYTASGGIVEQDPEAWWRGVCRNTRALMERRADCGRRVVGIGVSGQMLGCLPVDAVGAPLRRSMIHSDARAVAQTERVAEAVGRREAYRVTGNMVDPRCVPSKMLWLKEHEPGLYRSTECFVQSKDFIVGRMTGVFGSTDYSDAGHAQWMDISRREPASELIDALGLDAGKLPRLRSSTDVVGKVTHEASRALALPSGIPVVAGGGDGSCASVGAGAVAIGDTYGCIGTTAWIASISGQPFIDPHMRVFNITSLDGQTTGVFGTVQSAGRSVEWAMNLLADGDFGRFDDLLAGAPPGCDGLVFLPYLEGERSPIWDAAARGVYFGINPQHGRLHFLRAAVEGVSFALRSVLEVLREMNEFRSLRLIGGGGQSKAWRQMLADVCGLPTQELSTRAADATCVGAAIAAGVGVGLFDDLADGCRAIRVTANREPDPRVRAVYDRQFELYGSLYPLLAPAFESLESLG